MISFLQMQSLSIQRQASLFTSAKEKMNKGAFVISLDTELGWGRLDDPEIERFSSIYKKTPQIIRDIIRVFDNYGIPATWALTGRLLQTPDQARATPYSAYYKHIPKNVFSAMADFIEKNRTYFHLPEVVDWIKSSSVGHEIATHSFEHIVFGSPHTDDEMIRKDFTLGSEIFARLGIKANSMVYPRNSIAGLKEASEAGIKVYRGPDRTCYDALPSLVSKIIRQFDMLMALPPIVHQPELREGLTNIPGSMLFRLHTFGPRRYLPISRLTAKAVKGLQRAASQKGVFHLWFHPFNFAHRTTDHLRALETVCQTAAEMREKDLLQIRTMGSFVT